jgi:hypothetical protein
MSSCCLNAGGKKLDWNEKTAMAGSRLSKILFYNDPKTSKLMHIRMIQSVMKLPSPMLFCM